MGDVSRSPRLALILLALLLAGCSSGARVTGSGVVEVSGPMPELSGQTLQGGHVGPSDYAGRVVVVNFWATWCGPCRREQPELSAVQAEQAPDGAFFLGVNFRDDAAAARAYLKEFGIAYPSLSDPSGEIAHRFGVPYLPATIVVDASGEMRFRAVGALDAPTLRDLIARASGTGAD
jgi:thiol-disulfide isomerase/thioredoxin